MKLTIPKTYKAMTLKQPTWLPMSRPIFEEMSLLLDIIFKQHQRTGLDPAIPVPLHSKILRHIFTTTHAAKLIEFALDNKLITRNESYEAGAACKGYTWGFRFLECGIETIEIKRSPSVFKQISFERTKNEQAMQDPNIALIYGNFEFVTISETNDDFDNDLTYFQKDYDSRMIEEIKDQDFFIRRKPEARKYDTLTSLSKRVRKRLMINGKETIEIDVKSCFPDCLLVHIKRNYDQCDNEIIIWERMVKTGFYESLCDLFSMKLSDTKHAFQIWLNGTRSSVDEVMNDKFPKISEIVREIKKKDRGDMFRTLEKIESKLIIDCICPELCANHISFFTVHDAIFVEENAEIMAHLIMTKHLHNEGFVTRAVIKR